MSDYRMPKAYVIMGRLLQIVREVKATHKRLEVK